MSVQDMSKKKGKDKLKMENKPAYFDFQTLKIRTLQVRNKYKEYIKINVMKKKGKNFIKTKD